MKKSGGILPFFIPSWHAFYYVRTMTMSDTIYLDHAAGTFVLPEVSNQIKNSLADKITNPSSIHSDGRYAASILDSARRDCSSVIGCQANEIIFTSGGTEANNLAIVGLANAHQNRGKHIISCTTEHASVLASLEQLENDGFQVSYLSVDSNGEIDLEELNSTITSDTILISLMWINNETGLINPIKEIADIASKHDITMHCDAVQTLGHIEIQCSSLMVDAMTFSGHKIGTPAGIGVLYLREGTTLDSLSFGGNQENNLRAGTQNLLGSVAFATAATYQQDHLVQHKSQFESHMDKLINGLKKIPGIHFNRNGNRYSPHILNCSFDNVDGEALFIRLDMSRIAVSNGSACSSGSQSPSHVLRAMGIKDALAQASLRISLGIQTTDDEISRFVNELETIILAIRNP